MISELFADHPWLWPLVWQSTICLAAGLVGSLVLRRRPARAHQVLLLALAAAVLIPALSHVVKRNQWGLFKAERTVPLYQAQPVAIQTELVAATPTPTRTAAQPDTATAPATTVRPVTAGLDWRHALAVLWLAASSALLLQLTVRWLLGLALMRRSSPAESQQIVEAVDMAKAKLAVEGDVIVRASERACSPVIWCWGHRPVLLVPNDSCNDMNLDWQSILCHELAHWKRRDHLTGLFAELMTCLLPWQPLLWLARRRLVHLSEEACDDWVIASGQVGTRYARTLLGLTPLGQAALVPGVVTTRKGLAGRIHRIIEDRCGNPRTGLRWSLTAATLTVCVAVAIALAQTRAAQRSETIRVQAGPLASIEQLASAMRIKGQILGQDGKPAESAAIVALPVRGDGTSVFSRRNDNGCFELPWSPTWIREGEHPWLFASNDQQMGANEAVLVEVTDPAASVEVRLRPAAIVAGKVADPNGQPLKAKITVSLPQVFEQAVPIYDGGTDLRTPGTFSFWRVPYNHRYSLRLRADGYQAVEIPVDVTDTSLSTIDVGTIVMQPQDPAKPLLAQKEEIDPDLEKEFRELYRLDEGEVIKVIKPPYVLGRDQYLATMKHRGDGIINGYWSFSFLWNAEVQGRSATAGPLDNISLSYLLRIILRLPCYDYEILQDLPPLHFPTADWIIREGSSVEDQLKALEEIIQAETHRMIRFEKHTVERDTIVVTGRYDFTPLPDKDLNRLYVIARETNQLVDREAASVAELLRDFGPEIGVPLEDRTEPGQAARISYRSDYSLMKPLRGEPIDKDTDLPAMLDNLAKQTGLQFSVEKQPAEIWVVTEEKDG
jgi:beta-lactamase regulating signal transducer with metallopeptidase domain